MGNQKGVGILGLEAVHYYVNDLERSRAFYVDRLDFSEIAQSNPELEREGRQRSAAFRAGNCTVICSQPEGEGGRAWRYLQKHPAGIGTLIFAVEDAQKTLDLVESRGGTPITDVIRDKDESGEIAYFSLATPFGDATFRFVERKGFGKLYSGMEWTEGKDVQANRFGFDAFDHITSNFQTLAPALLWMEHVMGFERYWDIQFHTNDIKGDAGETGSGLKSVVMWDPASGVKFANNEPWRPYYKRSQINLFHEDHRGDGVQHLAMTVGDIIPAVEGLRERGIQFMPTPNTYYEMLPERIKTSGINAIEEEIDVLQRLEILIDGEADRKYLLQIFLKEAAGLYSDMEAGPFFFEIIQRKGDNGFGGGNFRALFDSIELQQERDGRI